MRAQERTIRELEDKTRARRHATFKYKQEPEEAVSRNPKKKKSNRSRSSSTWPF